MHNHITRIYFSSTTYHVIFKKNRFHFITSLVVFFIFGLLLFCFFGCGFHLVGKQENNSTGKIQETTTSPYSVTIKQSDGSTLNIMGQGNMYEPYTETVDGFTILRNNNGIYEYAVPNKNGFLQPGGVKSHNIDQRTRKEKRYLERLTMHFRNKSN
jgi:hypothetical protein